MNKVFNKIVIGGTSASFKSILCMQIDNHPDINVIHRHDKILQIFVHPFVNFSLFFEKYLKLQDRINFQIIKKNKLKKLIFKSIKKKFFFSPILLRKLLINHTGYYANEQYAWQKKIGSDISSLSSSSKKFDFQFYKYDKYIFNQIFNSKITNFSPEILNDIFLESFIYSQKKKLKKNILFMAPNTYESIDFLMKEKFNAKVIYLLRSPENIILSRAIRQIANEENITNKRLVQKKINKKIENILYANFYRSVLEQEKKILQLEKMNKKKLKIIKSEDLIYKNQQTIKDITQWLGIKNHKSLKDLHYDGFKIDKKKYLDKINDDDFIIDDSIKNFFFIQKNGIKNFIFNCRNKNLKVLIFLIKQFIYKNFKLF